MSDTSTLPTIVENNRTVLLRENDWIAFKSTVLASGDFNIDINNKGEDGETHGEGIINIESLSIDFFPGRGQRASTEESYDNFSILYKQILVRLNQLEDTSRVLASAIGTNNKVISDIKKSESIIRQVLIQIARELANLKQTVLGEDNQEQEEGDWEVDGEC